MVMFVPGIPRFGWSMDTARHLDTLNTVSVLLARTPQQPAANDDDDDRSIKQDIIFGTLSVIFACATLIVTIQIIPLCRRYIRRWRGRNRGQDEEMFALGPVRGSSSERYVL